MRHGIRRNDGHAAADDRPGLDGLSGGTCGLSCIDYNDGEPERSLTKDDLLDDVTLYWLTNSANLVRAAVLGERNGRYY